MDRHAGGADGYLRDEMGLSHADIVKLRRLYLR
jgi:protein-tyrosine phosphatase